ncbi:MAG TPA: triose-phosphate isomerase [Acetobacteraceae bacterium]|nr:triose-phosphate isomerase [Acetobacteraceae bacterium]
MRRLVVGNWKMNGLSAPAAELARAVAAGVAAGDGLPDLVLCPPFTQIAAVAAILAGTGIAVGGQDCHPEPAGPHTGDISAPMLRDVGARYVILGHSERRAAHAENDGLVRMKAVAAARAGLIPIVCVGETEAERDEGRAESVVASQVAGSLPEDFAGILAYEPVWAIGSGRTPEPGEIAGMHALIRARLMHAFGAGGKEMPILYGGSVKRANAAAIMGISEVGGGLIGGASLAAGEFLAIAAAARSFPGT